MDAIHAGIALCWVAYFAGIATLVAVAVGWIGGWFG